MIHQYKNNGYNIVLDIASGSVHVVDDLVYDMIELYQTLSETQIAEAIKKKYGQAYSSQDIHEAYGDITALKESGQLFTEDVYKDVIIDFKKRKTVVKALCLHVAHDCNMACKYCFADEGSYNGKPRELMSAEVGKKALDFLVEHSGNRVNLEVDFFGGEPLMNFEAVKEIVAYGRSIEKAAGKNFRFTLTTNGILLNDEVVEFCNKEISNVVLSLDGRKCVNDNMRPFANGKGSYDVIVPKFQNFVAKRGDKSYYVRGTFTRHNLDFLEDFKAMVDLGFREISLEPVVAGPDCDYSIREEDIWTICNQYDELAKYLIALTRGGTPVTFFHFMLDLNGGPCVYKRLSGCGSGTEYLAVTPTGELYPCHQFVSYDEFKLGNVFDGIAKTDITDEFKLCNVYAKDKCRDCFARFYCSGGCAANSFQFHGNILDAYDIGCKLQRKRVECAIMIKAALAELEEGE
ncbi:MAG: thioether cross-link-forming SCIFF peptide maturase [Clostridium sp.]|nr:thioether cross-link-forming SCIFF peptide maturase [Clostridium sp.]MCM1399109.1 thioether cross-link-forming SCIFF peptide maturase [Clostridium sp.]MCM1459501.1 thioether cross-link-forming SCIFF peptide maturase [Bacteroides sp.]